MTKKRRGRRRKLPLATLLDLQARVFKMAHKQPLLDSPEDAAQEYALRRLEGLHQNATLNQAVFDMVRERTGRKGQPGYQEKMKLAYALPHDTETDFRKHAPFERVDDILTVEHLMKCLNDQQFYIVRRYLEGYLFEDIAQELKLTESRVHQVYQKACKLMLNEYEGHKRWNGYYNRH